MRPMILCLVLLVTAPAAMASTGRHWSAADVSKALTVADAHWPASPCHGREVVQSADENVLQGDQRTDGGIAAEAYWRDGTCRVAIAWHFIAANYPTPDYVCTILEHEFGHLAGFPDTQADHDVMNWSVGDDNWIPADCARAFPAKQMCSYIPRVFVAITVRTMVARLCPAIHNP